MSSTEARTACSEVPQRTVGLGLSTARVAAAFGVALLVLNALNLYALVSDPVVEWLLLSSESNPSTWFSSFVLLVAAGALLLLAFSEPEGTTARRRWKQMALVPLLLSLDEVAETHERMGYWVQFDGATSITGRVWVLPGVLVLAGLGLLFGSFVFQQSRRVVAVLVVGAALTIGGGVIVETIGGVLQEHGHRMMTLRVLTTIEENLEMLGIGVAAIGLLDVAGRRGIRLDVRRVDSTPAE